jgi:signal transduction histidine kinase
MIARVTTDTHLRRGRPRAQMIVGAPLLENTVSIITVEPNQQTRNTFPVEARRHVIFSVSLGTDGIWRIERFNGAFAEIFGAPHRSGGNGAQYTLPLTFATKLAGALSQCAENGRPVGLGVAFQIEGRVHHWEFLLESGYGPDALPNNILVHGHDVTDLHQTLRDLRRVTSQDDGRRRIARDLYNSVAHHLNVLGFGIARLEALAERRNNLACSASRTAITDMRTTLKQADNEIRTLGLLLHPPELDETQMADALRSFVARFVRRTGIQANAHR